MTAARFVTIFFRCLDAEFRNDRSINRLGTQEEIEDALETLCYRDGMVDQRKFMCPCPSIRGPLYSLGD